MRKPTYTKEELALAVAASKSYREIYKNLGIKGYNYKSLYYYISKYGLDISHIYGRKSRYKMDTILVANSPFVHNGHLKNRLIKEGIKQACCEGENCHITEWHGKPLQLHLHHVNGDAFDNRLENLQILCPNCHSQTENYGHKNKSHGR